MKIKQGVDLLGIKPEMIPVIINAEIVFMSYGVEAVITSALDGIHSKKSLHQFGFALDWRTRNVTRENAIKIKNDLQSKLGKQYQVILEKDHLHTEFDMR